MDHTVKICGLSTPETLDAALAAGATGTAAQSDREDEAYTPLNRPVESSDLPPALLPLDLWRGVVDVVAA